MLTDGAEQRLQRCPDRSLAITRASELDPTLLAKGADSIL